MYEYKDLIDLVKQDDYSEQDVYLLSNHNGELFGQNHLNILDARSFSIDLIHEVNHRLLTIPGKNVTYDTLELDQEAFVDRIDSLAAYYKEMGDFRNHGVLKGIEQTVLHLEPGYVTIKKSPNLLVKDQEILHHNLLKNSFIRRVLSGFVTFREVPRKDILNLLQHIFASS